MYVVHVYTVWFDLSEKCFFNQWMLMFDILAFLLRKELMLDKSLGRGARGLKGTPFRFPVP